MILSPFLGLNCLAIASIVVPIPSAIEALSGIKLAMHCAINSFSWALIIRRLPNDKFSALGSWPTPP